MMALWLHEAIMPTQHPKVIDNSKRVIGTSPSGHPLYGWDEVYPDGTIRSFGEFWTSCTGQSGIVYGLSVVLPL